MQQVVALPPPPSPTVGAIYAAYEAEARDGFRDHLGASLIGRECERAIWYSWRWAKKVAFEGRILRLFGTGHIEEKRLIADLRKTGATVLDVDPDTGRQWTFRAGGGHFGGSADAIAVGLLEAPKTWHIVEIKTHNRKSFAALRKHGVEKSKPEHHAQMQVYMHQFDVDRAMYVAICKDTDEIVVERVKRDHEFGLRMVAKAERIIASATPPPRISDDPAWYICRFCDYHDICHGDAPAERNCRTCLQSTSKDGGSWVCARWEWRIGFRDQLAGCWAHLYIPDLVHGEVIEASTDGFVRYKMRDGSEWTDEEKEQ